MRLLGSLSFRLALIYASLLTLSVAVLGALYYVIAIRGPLEGVRDELRTEGAQYRVLFEARGGEALGRALERRAGEPSPRAGYHAFIDASGATVTANLPSWPHARTRDWIRVEADVAREGDEDEYEALVLDRPLAGGGRLLLGRDIEDLDELEEGIKDTLFWLVPALAVLALVGGALMSRTIGRRLDSVSSTARRVIAGGLDERIALRGTGDDFDRLGATLNLMLDRIEESLGAVRRVSDSVAHELRTPLTRARASLATLEQEGGSAAVSEAVAEIERLKTIFDAVLRISRIESVREPPREAVDLSTVAEDAADLYLPAADARAQRLSTDIEAPLWVLGDRDLLFQAFGNLLDNAVKFTPRGGSISLSARAEGEEVVVRVQDSGPGIAPELRGRITERFFRGDATDAVPGLGLGLALVSAVASLHGAPLSFSSTAPGLRVEWRFRRAANPR